jgi:nicotinamide riboside transporter PnuC
MATDESAKKLVERRMEPGMQLMRRTHYVSGGVVFRLDYLSCVLTIVSTILVGRRYWEGWIVAAINSVVICLIGFRTSQFGFIPANVFCVALYAVNLRSWRKPEIR